MNLCEPYKVKNDISSPQEQQGHVNAIVNLNGEHTNVRQGLLYVPTYLHIYVSTYLRMYLRMCFTSCQLASGWQWALGCR